MREKGYTHAEIAQRLGYKTHSAVTKRLKAMREKYDEFCGYVENRQKKQKKKYKHLLRRNIIRRFIDTLRFIVEISL